MDEATARRDAYKKGKAALWLIPWAALEQAVDIKCACKARGLHAWARGSNRYVQFLGPLLDDEMLSNAAHVLEKSLSKYTATDWEKGYSFLKIASAGLRHAVAAKQAKYDPDSGLPHAWHLDANLIMAYTYDYDLEGMYAEFDDRPKLEEPEDSSRRIIGVRTEGAPVYSTEFARKPPYAKGIQGPNGVDGEPEFI